MKRRTSNLEVLDAVALTRKEQSFKPRLVQFQQMLLSVHELNFIAIKNIIYYEYFNNQFLVTV